MPFVSYPARRSGCRRRGLAAARARAPVDRGGDDPEGLVAATSSSTALRLLLSSDVGSFESLREGEPWAGYRQFCMLFLYLLLDGKGAVPALVAREPRGDHARDVPPALSARPPAPRRGHARRPPRPARAQPSGDEGSVKGDLRASGFRKELILANVGALERRVARLAPRARGSAWSAYEPTTSYVDADAERKEAFVSAALASERPRRVGPRMQRRPLLADGGRGRRVRRRGRFRSRRRRPSLRGPQGGGRDAGPPLTIDPDGPVSRPGLEGEERRTPRRPGTTGPRASAWRSCTTCRSRERADRRPARLARAWPARS